MALPNPNAPEVLRKEILAAAECECGRILRIARETAESCVARATTQAEQIRTERLDAAHAEAARRRELIMATVPVETGNMRAKRTESILETIHETARRRLESHHSNAHETVVALATEAITRMPGTDFVVKLSPEDQAQFGNRLADEISRSIGRSPLKIAVSADPETAGGGVIVQSADGRQFWDNRLSSRLERLWPALRREIAAQTGLVERNDSMGDAP